MANVGIDPLSIALTLAFYRRRGHEQWPLGPILGSFLPKTVTFQGPRFLVFKRFARLTVGSISKFFCPDLLWGQEDHSAFTQLPSFRATNSSTATRYDIFNGPIFTSAAVAVETNPRPRFSSGRAKSLSLTGIPDF